MTARGTARAAEREVLLVVHTGRRSNADRGRSAAARLAAAGIRVRLLLEEADELALPDPRVVPADEAAAQGVELVLVLGGDGTILRAAELARPTAAPVLGVNLGRVGFLAEAEVWDLEATLERVVAKDYRVEERLTLGVTVHLDGQVVHRDWALNEVAVEKGDARMLEALVEVDARPVTRFGCDAVVLATPTGSTAYAFSGGGPVVWPEVEALLLVPISAHALFTRPLVTAPSSVLAVEVQAATAPAGLHCDGRRSARLAPGSRVEVRRGDQPVRLARIADAPFTDRLVAKFGLPVEGWRGPVQA